MEARDTFSRDSSAYARDRPVYPTALFDWMVSHCRARSAAWDCATGNGQAASRLAERFERVEATDISREQIGAGFRAGNVVYSVQPAERTCFADASFDLITVAQALHWFDFGSFWPEVRRVSKPGAFFCAWGYAWFEGDQMLQERFLDPMAALLAPYWATNNRILWHGYRSEEIAFPFERIAAPPFSIMLDWDIAAVIRFVQTWSAYKRALLDPERAAHIERLERNAIEGFAARGTMALALPLAIAAGTVA